MFSAGKDKGKGQEGNDYGYLNKGTGKSDDSKGLKGKGKRLVRAQVVEKAVGGTNMAISRIATKETTPGVEVTESGRLRRLVQLRLAPRYLRGFRHLRQRLRVERPRRKNSQIHLWDQCVKFDKHIRP